MVAILQCDGELAFKIFLIGFVVLLDLPGAVAENQIGFVWQTEAVRVVAVGMS